MGVSKVEFGNETLIDLTEDTVTPQSLLSGYSAHNKAGELIEGLLQNPEELNKEIETLKRNINDGKKLVANAITEKGVTTAADAAFATMAANIGKIVTSGNIHLWENTANGTYKFVQQGARWVANNQGINSTTASSTWKVTLSKAVNYNISWRTATETNYDKLTITVNGTTIVNAVSGVKTVEQNISVSLKAGENTIVATYVKDGSNSSFGDMAYIVLTPVTEVIQPGSKYKYQSKSVTPGSSAQTVYPDTGYDGLYSVSVAAMSGSNRNFNSGSGTFPTANSANISLNIGFVPKILVIYGIKADKSFGYVTTYNANFNSGNEYGAQLPIRADGTAYVMSKKVIGSTNATIKSIGSTTIISCGNITGWRGHPMTWYAWG